MLLRRLLSTRAPGAVEQRIVQKLTSVFTPVHLDIQNESYKHSVPPQSETHFKVLVVSEQFTGLRMVKQHRLVNKALAAELATGVHALSIQTETPERWRKHAQPATQARETPNCLGGGKK
jgi:BolA protein